MGDEGGLGEGGGIRDNLVAWISLGMAIKCCVIVLLNIHHHTDRNNPSIIDYL